MAKSSKSKKRGKGDSELHVAPPEDPAVGAFLAGDFSKAKGMFAARASDASASESQRQEAARFLAAVTLDKGLLYVALACLGLFSVAVIATVLTQP